MQDALLEVHASNALLEQRVEERTAELTALQKSDRGNFLRLKNMFAHLPMAASATDENDVIIEANELFCEMCQLGSSETLIGRNRAELAHK